MPAPCVAACASLAPRPQSPQVALDSVTSISVGATTAQVRVRLSVKNPNGYDLAVDALDYSLAIDGRRLGSGALVRPVTLAANAVTSVEFDIAADMSLMGNSLDRAIRHGALPYELDGAVELAGGARLPFHRRGKFDPLRALLH